MFMSLGRIFVVSMMCSFCFSHKAFAFDYDTYSKTHKQLRAINPDTTITTAVRNNKHQSTNAFAVFTQQLLQAMQSDAVPVKVFDTGTNISLYFKPAKVTKIGIKYKF